MHLRRWAVVVLITLLGLGGFAEESSAQDLLLQELFKEQLDIQGIGPITDMPTSEAFGAAESVIPTKRSADFYEEEYRRLAREKKLDRMRPTPLEIDYSSRAGVDLQLFGYELFHNYKYRNVATNIGGAPDDYVLGVGDTVVVTFRGQLKKRGDAEIDSEGRLVLADLPPFIAAGQTFGEMRQHLKSVVQETLLGTEVYVSLGSVRRMSILVVGEVYSPGVHALPAYSSIIDAIAISGGIRKTGSLRNIQVVRGDEIFWLDLYDLIFMVEVFFSFVKFSQFNL